MSRSPIVRQHGNPYELFILTLTVLSLAIIVLLLLPLSPATTDALLFYDNLICFVFLADFAYNLSGSHPRSEYVIRHRGWLDLLGSIPALGIFRFTGLFRLARLSRLARILRLLRGQKRGALIEDVIRNRSQYALFVTLMTAMLVLVTASVAVLQFESSAANANIRTGGEALWWAFVTITTVGYGDFFPVTTLGRATAVGVMFAGIGLIGALASILASLLVASPASPDVVRASDADPATRATPSVGVEASLAALHAELRAMRAELAELRASASPSPPIPDRPVEP